MVIGSAMKSATIRAVKLVSRSFSEVAENVGGRTRKVIRTKDNRPIVQSRRSINEELDSKAAASGLGWRICAAS